MYEYRLKTYRIARGIFLFSSNHHALSLGSIEGTLPSDSRFARSTTRAVFGSNTGDRIPVAHFVKEECVEEKRKFELLKVVTVVVVSSRSSSSGTE